MGIIAAFIALGLTTVFLWVIIYLVTGNSNHDWAEMFIWALFLILISAMKSFMQILSTDPGFLLSVKLLSSLIIGILLYFLLGLRLGLLDVRKKFTIVGTVVGARLILGLLV
jgi:hypothetical protein